VNQPRHIHNLALVGFMGTGKSSVGRIVADALQFEFVDTDALIEVQSGRSIVDIFAQAGEPVFRKLEEQVVAELAKRKGLVISTGGGLVMNPCNLTSLKSHALVVCLWASAETIYERVRSQTHRPLLQTPDPLAKIKQMLTERGPTYRKADVLIHTGLRSAREVALQVVHQFHIARRSKKGGC
jgi:shikimate kinase